MKIRFGIHKPSCCWKFRFSFTKYWDNKLWWFEFWRFFMTWDFRKNIISDIADGIQP